MLHEPIHGVVVSDNYSDYLDISLSHNRNLFDQCVVVTSLDDKATQAVASKHACRVVMTNDGKPDPDNNRSFNKGLMIERGLQQLPEKGWRVHFDADILFPGNMRPRLATALYDKSCIYSADRMNIVDWSGYQKLLSSQWSLRGFEHQHYLNYSINKAELGSRLIYHDQGWVPIGYLQIWHSESEYRGSIRVRTYPTGSNSAAHDDVQFGLLWDRNKRILIPEIYVAHLTTSDSKYGANWLGRRTRTFSANNDDQASPKKAELKEASYNT